MAKAITEVAIGAAVIAAPFVLPGMGVAISAAMMHSLVAAGASMALSGGMAGISQLTNKNQGGIAVGTTSPVGPWGYIYGVQKVGGIEIFRESNNAGGVSNDKTLHRVYLLACHPCMGDAANFQLRVDGKQVQVTPRNDGTGWQSVSPTQLSRSITSMVRDGNGLVTLHLASGIAGLDGTTAQIVNASDNTFNGNWLMAQPNPADNTTYTFVCGGTPGSASGGVLKTLYADYKDKICIQFLNGNHTSTFSFLLNSGTNWSATDLCLGRTLVYVRMGYDEEVFPSSIPNLSFVVYGKNDILDPRTGRRGYTNNAALCIADFMSLPATQGGFSLTIGTDIPTDQLIAAANICDESVPLAAGGTTRRYTCDTYLVLNQGRGAILQSLLSSCAGRLSYQGGQYHIVPGSWAAPTLQLTDADIVGAFSFKPRLSIRDTCNAVKGTYVSLSNNYQQGDFPPYMQDEAHGYASDVWLAEDNGERIFKDVYLPCTTSPAAAQRIAKIELLRSRYQMRGTIRCSMKAYQAVALDVIQLSHPRYTWVNKNFEVLSSRFVQEKSASGAPLIAVELDLAETDPSIYGWSIGEELTAQGYAQPDSVGNRVCSPPEKVIVYSGPGETINGVAYPSTVTIGADGSTKNSLYVSWIEPNDRNVLSGGHMEVQWQRAGDSSWTAFGKFDPSVSCCFIPSVSEGSSYNVQVRAVNCASVPSIWIIAGPEVISNTYSTVSYSGTPVAPVGTLTAQGLSDGTAQIQVATFTPNIGGGSTAACYPNPSTLPGLNQSQLYYVYYVDPTFSGGSITPIPTQNTADFLNKAGHFLIGSITTPSYVPRYQPSNFSVFGSESVIDPAATYDNDVNSMAMISASWWTALINNNPPVYRVRSSYGSCAWVGFPSAVTGGELTLNVRAAVFCGYPSAEFSCRLAVSVAGVSSTIATFTAQTENNVYTFTIPTGTDLSTVNVYADASITPGEATPGARESCSIYVSDIYIQ